METKGIFEQLNALGSINETVETKKTSIVLTENQFKMIESALKELTKKLNMSEEETAKAVRKVANSKIVEVLPVFGKGTTEFQRFLSEGIVNQQPSKPKEGRKQVTYTTFRHEDDNITAGVIRYFAQIKAPAFKTECIHSKKMSLGVLPSQLKKFLELVQSK